ncbi:MAG: site-specific integrase [Syntrophales bacterium LBB04]|nr:site-specific integrase [Syntrophales bacterium LBB04]
MRTDPLLAPWIRRFLLEHLVSERNLAHNTQISYRDTLVLLLPFIAHKVAKPLDRLAIEDIRADSVRQFLLELEQTRGCSISTRNQRLAAIHALARFIGERNPEHLAWLTEIRSIPFKKTSRASLAYLEKHELDALLTVPDRRHQQGARDHALLFFLYNSGARASEAAQLTIADLDLGTPPSVTLLGKGGKARRCPLWPQTIDILTPLIAGRKPHEAVFLNRRRQPITRFGIRALVKRCVLDAGQTVPSIAAKRISTHTIRHTTAVHLLRSGIDINTIRAWLGHVSLDTTHIYAEVDFEMKAKALAHCEIPQTATATPAHWSTNLELMAFLKSL